MTTKMVFPLNGIHGSLQKVKPALISRWNKWHFDEWTFSWTLFFISSAIVLGKLVINYGVVILQQLKLLTLFHTSNAPNFSKTYQDIAVGAERIVSTVNTSLHYEDFVNIGTINLLKTYSWFLKAVVCGIATTGFTWFILYKDSNVPGINPPSPFSPKKPKFQEHFDLPINYLLGMINGILIFIYMCL